MANNDPMIGATLGDYEIVDALGKGGMATVYEGLHRAINRTVAIKVLPQTFVHDETFMERFRREAQYAAQLEHFHILPIYDYGEHTGIPYIVMRYLEGGTLQDVLKQYGAQPWDTCLQVMEQVSSALDYAHSKGVIHRDLKPSNIMFDADGNAYLADFGIAGIMETTSNLTGSGVVGTPTYMSPEQSNSAVPSPAMDIYSLGITLFEMISGEVPFKADTPIGVMMQHLSAPPPSVRESNPKIPPSVDLVLGRALSKYPEDRYNSAADFTSAFERAIEQSGDIDDPNDGLGMIPPIERISRKNAADRPGERNDYVDTLVVEPNDPQPGENTMQSARSDVPATSVQQRDEQSRSPLVPILAAVAAFVILGGGGFIIFADPFGLNIVGGGSVAEVTETPTPTDEPTATTEPTATLTLTPTEGPTSTPEPTELPTDTPVPTETPLPTALPADTFLRGIRMILIPAGTFIMGDNDGRPNERPEHEIYLDAYYIDETEVTNEAYSACVQEQGCEEPEFIDSSNVAGYYTEELFQDYPLLYPTWFEARDYCEWRGGHLPTEAQWEKAARHDPSNDEDYLFPWGDFAPNSFIANYYPTRGATVEVKSLPRGASPYGVYEMAGNVSEWVNDWYQDNYYELGPSENPLGPAEGEFKVFRGGSYDTQGRALATTYRDFYRPATQEVDLGFRCAFTPGGLPGQ